MEHERRWFPLTGPVTAPRGRVAGASKKPGPVDPLTGPMLALAGRVVVMNDNFDVHPDAIVYVNQGAISAVLNRAQPTPAAFAGIP